VKVRAGDQLPVRTFRAARRPGRNGEAACVDVLDVVSNALRTHRTRRVGQAISSTSSRSGAAAGGGQYDRIPARRQSPNRGVPLEREDQLSPAGRSLACRRTQRMTGQGVVHREGGCYSAEDDCRAPRRPQPHPRPPSPPLITGPASSSQGNYVKCRRHRRTYRIRQQRNGPDQRI